MLVESPPPTAIAQRNAPALDPEALIEEARRWQRRKRRRRVAVVLTMVAALALLIGTYFVDGGRKSHANTNSSPAALGQSERTKLTILKVYFTSKATGRQKTATARELKGSRDVVALKFISKAEALVQIKKTNPSLVSGLAYNPLPDSFVVTVSKPGDAQVVRSLLQPLPPGVAGVYIKG
jgi:cell division protein FtsX